MKTVFITGAGRGLGLEFARQFAVDGWRVIGTIRHPKAAESLAALGKNVEIHVVDVRDLSAIAALATKLRGTAIDVLICNAGIRGRLELTFGGIDYAEWEEVLRVNVIGATAVAEALVDNVAASERKVIVMLSSRFGSIAACQARQLAYSSSKAALNWITKAMSIILESRGITVVAVSPGWVRTEMGGESATLAPEVSITGLRKVIVGLTPKQSGRFFHYDGTEVPW